jgi:NAD(P)-dependent dehydrogenase (short-subunit alcohol dehydrogenase family)
MSDKGQKVAIFTGGCQGIGASLVTAYRRRRWSVVATARAIKPAQDPDVPTVDGDLADPPPPLNGDCGRVGLAHTAVPAYLFLPSLSGTLACVERYRAAWRVWVVRR